MTPHSRGHDQAANRHADMPRLRRQGVLNSSRLIEVGARPRIGSALGLAQAAAGGGLVHASAHAIAKRCAASGADARPSGQRIHPGDWRHLDAGRRRRRRGRRIEDRAARRDDLRKRTGRTGHPNRRTGRDQQAYHKRNVVIVRRRFKSWVVCSAVTVSDRSRDRRGSCTSLSRDCGCRSWGRRRAPRYRRRIRAPAGPSSWP